MSVWLEKRDEVIIAARKLVRLDRHRIETTKPYVPPLFAMSMLAAAIVDLDEEEGRQ